tara:strand:+ start:4931 stop:5395 length:465 start_codon:yes stop_codon:yes gene_type:complete
MPTKNYSNSEVTISSTDDFATFEKTYEFASVYRRVLGNGTLGTTLRGIIATADIGGVADGHVDTVHCMPLKNITYVRIKNISSSSSTDIHVHGYSTGVDGGNKFSFEIESGEAIQFHSKLKMGDHDTAEVDWLYLALEASTSSAGADIFIGCSS